jgi:hypothetical protein
MAAPSGSGVKVFKFSLREVGEDSVLVSIHGTKVADEAGVNWPREV